MQTAFDCLCGASVSARGEWDDEKEADLVETCDACGRKFVLTYTSLPDGRTPPTEAETSDVSETDTADTTEEESTLRPRRTARVNGTSGSRRSCPYCDGRVVSTPTAGPATTFHCTACERSLTTTDWH